ncbi:MAG: helix-turn-helix domain-containing protein [Planctomycetes bacterium]|nr:helix-turn-helix domain-containing protein [Planctomycetota bacterium]
MSPQRFIKTLTKTDRQEVEKLFRCGPNNRTRKRAQAIRLSAMGYTITQIVEILGCNRQSIHNWFDIFETQGYQGLCDRPRFGKPVTATAALGSNGFNTW